MWLQWCIETCCRTYNNTGTAVAPHNRNKKVIFENFAPFTNCLSKIHNTQVDDAQNIDVTMLLYNLIEYGNI